MNFLTNQANSLGFPHISHLLKTEYVTDEHNVIDEFYAPMLQNSVEYVRAAGFFRSSVFRLMTEDLLDFALRGGKMTLITSVKVNKADYESIIDALDESILLNELREMRERPEQIPVTEMLASLISCGCLTVKIGIRKSGIYHRKKGYFRDETGNTVVFSGSGNETYTALHPEIDEGSAEDFEIYWDWDDAGSWKGRGDRKYERLHNEAFKSGVPTTKIVSINEVPEGFFDFIDDEIDVLDLERHRPFAADQKKKMRKLWEEHYGDDDVYGDGPETLTLRPHQLEGIEAWKENGFRGILKHATASGKTITAISHMIEHLSGGLPVLVIVPGGILLGQWEEEILRFDPDAEILLASGNHDWRADLGIFLEKSPQPDNRRVVIAVDETAKKSDFLDQVGGLDSALVIIDECHNIGAPGYSGVWEWSPNKILGLSATPERMDSGTSQVFSLCGEIIHEYSINQAIKDGYLSKYHYHIERVSLTKDESSTYDNQMDVVSRLLAIHGNPDGTIDWASLPKHVQLKIFEAKKIIKKAINKTEKCAEIVEENFVGDGSQRWLIYCQDSDQMSEVKTALKQRDISPIYEYWSNADGAIIDGVKQQFQYEETLEMWTSTGGVMLSIKCLDEGVSIDEISHGIILASSKNPREFIQRRGRLLRLSPNKTHAEIWDALVVPDSSTRHNDFILDEINRALEFSNMAENLSARIELTKIANELGLTGISFGTED